MQPQNPYGAPPAGGGHPQQYPQQQQYGQSYPQQQQQPQYGGYPPQQAPPPQQGQYGGGYNYPPQQQGPPQYAPPSQYGAPQGFAPPQQQQQYGAPQYGAPQYGSSQGFAPPPQHPQQQYGAPQGAGLAPPPQQPQPQYGAPPPGAGFAPPPQQVYAQSAPAVLVAAPPPQAPALRVRVIQANGLASADANGKSDPYAIVRWEGQPRAYTKQAGQHDRQVTKLAKHGKIALVKTQVVHKSLNPVWNEVFQLNLVSVPAVQPHDILTLELYDYDRIGQHDFLGSVHAEMAGLVMGVERQMQLPVMSKKGTVTIALTALNFSVPPPMGMNDPHITANRQIAAESARKRAAYKKAKACEKNVGSVFGKDAGVVARKLGLHKLF